MVLHSSWIGGINYWGRRSKTHVALMETKEDLEKETVRLINISEIPYDHPIHARSDSRYFAARTWRERDGPQRDAHTLSFL
jgi:hypothetical protein